MKELFIIGDEVKTPPFSHNARRETGYLLRKLQDGETLSMPHSKPIPEIGKGCHELRIKDGEKKKFWRIMYFTTPYHIIILGVFEKKSNKTPKHVIETCKKRMETILGD